MESTNNTAKLDAWCLVELFGHQRIVGHVTETTVAGGAFVRVDVPKKGTNGDEIEFTRFFGPSAIYSISPIQKELAVEFAESLGAAPISSYDVPALTRRVTDQVTKSLPARSESILDQEEDIP